MAGKSLGTLTLDLLVKTGSFIEGFSKAERESKRFKQNLERNLNGAAKAFAGLVAGATVASLRHRRALEDDGPAAAGSR
jgi:hypothetical protein